MRTQLRAATTAAALTVAAVVTQASAGPVHAETRTVRDPAGDNYTRTVDLRSATHSNTTEVITSAVKVKRLTRRTALTFNINTRDGAEPHGVVVRWRKGKLRTQLWDLAFEGPGTKISCDIATDWQPKRNNVTVDVPASCLKIDTRALQMDVFGWDLRVDTISDSTRTLLVRRD
jgi:hypothetical protein